VQAWAQEGFSIGIKAGPGFSQFFFQRYVEQNFVQVFQKGIIVSHRDSKNFGVQLEVLQTQKAFEEIISESVTQTVSIDYWESMLLSTYKFGKRKSGIVLYAGMHFSNAIDADTSRIMPFSAPDTSFISYFPFKYSNWDYGIGGGLGYQLCIGRSILQLDIIYSQGLRNLFDRKFSGIYRSLNQRLFLNLGYKFSLARTNKRNLQVLK
jgi:hypothetical protein